MLASAPCEDTPVCGQRQAVISTARSVDNVLPGELATHACRSAAPHGTILPQHILPQLEPPVAAEHPKPTIFINDRRVVFASRDDCHLDTARKFDALWIVEVRVAFLLAELAKAVTYAIGRPGDGLATIGSDCQAMACATARQRLEPRKSDVRKRRCGAAVVDAYIPVPVDLVAPTIAVNHIHEPVAHTYSVRVFRGPQPSASLVVLESVPRGFSFPAA